MKKKKEPITHVYFENTNEKDLLIEVARPIVFGFKLFFGLFLGFTLVAAIVLIIWGFIVRFTLFKLGVV